MKKNLTSNSPVFDIPPLRPFFAVAQTGGFSSAAERLCISQSAVSHSVRKIETFMGTLLFIRRGKSLKLTEAGKQLYQACENSFYSLEDATDSIKMLQEKGKGYLRLGSNVEFGCTILMKHIKPFMEKNPGMEIDFLMSHDLINPLIRDELDVIIDCNEHRIKGISRTPLFREKYVLVISPELLLSVESKTLSFLESAPILSLDKDGKWWEHFLSSLPHESRPTLSQIIAVNHVRGMITAAVEGIGIALLPKYSIMKELNDGLLKEIFPKLALPEDCFCLYQKEKKSANRKHRLLTDYLSKIKPSEFGD
ncbi:MAG: LysR family transcriptional regulator [Candidatus Riflebacteria bacterium]|nr:LysR family transcriptional regulator [Candidatus Riflebacteria bacterium]